jgi:hypothetical protein
MRRRILFEAIYYYRHEWCPLLRIFPGAVWALVSAYSTRISLSQHLASESFALPALYCSSTAEILFLKIKTHAGLTCVFYLVK